MGDLTEREVEDLLVADPSLLEDQLVLIARQPTIAVGRPDLIGIDKNGRLVVFELKIGRTTRDAVAQALDYSTWLDEAGLIGVHSVVSATPQSVDIVAIDNILAWYHDRFPENKPEDMLPTRVVLVGSGADPAAERMVSQLRESGVSIELRLLPDLEVADPARTPKPRAPHSRPRSSSQPGQRRPLNTSGKNWSALQGTTNDFGVSDLFDVVLNDVDNQIVRLRGKPFPIGAWYYMLDGRRSVNHVGVDVLRQHRGYVGLLVFEHALGLIDREFIYDLRNKIDWMQGYQNKDPIHTIFRFKSIAEWETHREDVLLLVSEIDENSAV